MFDPLSRLHLEETLSYERFLLKDCASHNSQVQGIVEPFILIRNDAPPHEMRIMIEDSLGATYVAEFITQISPLLFCSAYKLLDMVVEWIIQENTNTRPWRFQEKILKLRTTSLTFPDFIGGDVALREALLSLYTELVEYRNAITHGHWGENRNGDLHFDFQKRGQPVQSVVSSAQVTAFGNLMSQIGNCLVTPAIQSPLVVLQLKFILDQLTSLHRKSAFNQKLPRRYRVVRKTTFTGQPIRVDIGSIRTDLEKQALGNPYGFSLRIEADTATGKLLWEIPEARVPAGDFDLDATWDAYKVQS